MKKWMFMLPGLMLSALLFSHIIETASLKNFIYDRDTQTVYDNWISHVAEGIASANYNLYAPYDRQTNGFGDYRIPSVTELENWGNVIDAFLVLELDMAQGLIDTYGFPYQAVQFNDTDSGRTYYMLRELPNMSYLDDNGTIDDYDDEIGAFAYGWGLYIYNPDSPRPLIVTVPHPTDDYPTPAIGHYAFDYWNAKFLYIAGAGREVKWTQVGNFANSKSISDPTRWAAHPFNTAYNKSCDLIRSEFNQRELSAQIHTYDWNRHVGAANVQVAAGYGRPCPNLPIRDLSNLQLDLINQGNHLMLPANTVGVHNDVFLNDYYTVYYNTHEFNFTDGDINYPVNNYVTLTGAEGNRQQVYSISGISDYDVYEPFFHIEMDELPSPYDETQNTFKWFYGWNEATQRWDFNNLFTNFTRYYSRWIHDLDIILDPLFAMNDNVPPTDPTNLVVHNQSLNHISLRWNRSFAYDFHSYEILYATEPIGLANYQIFSRDNNNFLASQAAEQVNVTGLNNSSVYYFRIRAVDKNGQYSDQSNEVVSIPAPANVTEFNAYGLDESVRLAWTVSGQNNNLGFKVYRKTSMSDFILIDSYATNAALSNSNNSYTMEYFDNNVENGVTYTYQISAVNGNDLEFIHNFPASCSPRPIHTVTISNQIDTLTNTISFSNNPFASDGQDVFYDVSTSGASGSNYVWNAFWQQYWGNQGTYLSREIKGTYNPDTEIKQWVMRTRSDQTSQTLKITASNTFTRTEKLYLYDAGAGTWHNLLANPYLYTNANADIRTMNLYWGNLQPKVTLSYQPNRIYQGGTAGSFYWSVQYPFLVDHMELFIQNSTDSLWVASNIPGSQSSYTYSFSSQTDMQNCRFVIDLYATDGVLTRYTSDYVFGIVPAMSFLYSDPGWKMRSNPWNTSQPSIVNVFGDGASGYLLNDGYDWIPMTPFNFGDGYFVHNPEPAFYSTNNPVLRDSTSFILTSGWNLIPNPHLCAYNVKDLRFRVNNIAYKFSEMMEQRLVSRGVYVYREGQYQFVTEIQPYESFLLKYYGAPPLTSYIHFFPYYNGPSITPQAALWELNVTASQTGYDADGFAIGITPYSSDAYDFRLDLPKPLNKPFDGVRMYLTRIAEGDTLWGEQLLYSEYQTPLPVVGNSTNTWNFTLEIPAGTSTNQLQISFEQINVPDNYSLFFHLGDFQYNLNHGTPLTLNLPEAGVYHGQIRANNYPVSNQDLIAPAFTALKVYPNPFNPVANISFSLGKTTHVSCDIYNIRGQKVKSLFKGDLKAGANVLQWNGRDEGGRSVASGIYFVKVHTPARTQIIKTMLLK